MMFEDLTAKFERAFKFVRGRGKLNETDLDEFLREVRRVLLDADVNYKAVKEFIESVKLSAAERNIYNAVNPGQLIMDIINFRLAQLMGERNKGIKFSDSIPSVVMLVGLQGSGKTTFAVKLARFLKIRGRHPALAACDVRRPAAMEQLKALASQIDITVISKMSGSAVEIASEAIDFCRKNLRDTLIIDTAGRLAIDDEMMKEAEDIKKATNPAEILFVVDAMTGQDAVNTAKAFHERLDFDGVVLTKLDGDARGGAALSVRAVVNEPIKFVSIGEKLDAMEPFHPDRMASRILGRGDLASLAEKAAEILPKEVDEGKVRRLEEKLKKNKFDFADFLEQLQQIKKMGSLSQMIGLIPGADRILRSREINEKPIKKAEAIILSMTEEERENPELLNGSRRKRIAAGSGTTIQEVNRLVKQFYEMRKMIKQVSRGKFSNIFRNIQLN